MVTQPAYDFWPEPLCHCSQSLALSADEYITIGEVTSELVNGFTGNRMLYTALVPIAEVGSVVNAVGGIGHGVITAPLRQTSGLQGSYTPHFSVYSPAGSDHFESLIHTWESHNKIVLLPDDGLLKYHELIPRVMQDGSTSWDDLRRPIYDVVLVHPVSNYSIDTGYTTARVRIRRDYLEDYLSFKNCAAVATFYDERFSTDDPEVAELIGDQGSHFQLPGRELWFMSMAVNAGNQISQVWGCAVLLVPTARPISDPPELELLWPDRDLSIKGSGRRVSFKHGELVYVRDEVLTEYEKRSEFEISPEWGFVSYENRWSVSYCRRFGRNHIQLELRKLYEGAPDEVIKHYNEFAVKEAVAQRDLQIYGARHIGIRAKELVARFLELTDTVAALSGGLGLSFDQEDIGQFKTGEIVYRGWWTFQNLQRLGDVVPLKITFSDFLDRCKEIFKLFENLRPAPLRNILIQLGIKKEEIKDFGSVKLLATVCQLADASKENGYDLVSDRALVGASWNSNRLVTAMQALFALNTLRTSDAHTQSTSTTSKALKVLGIDEAQCRAGWGQALDQVYDKNILAIHGIANLIREAWKRNR